MKNILYLPLALTLLVGCRAHNDQKIEEKAEVALYDYDVEGKIADLNIELPEMTKPLANYVHAVRTGNLVFLAGKGPRNENGEIIKGKLGDNVSIEEGYDAAKRVAIAQLGALKAEIGDLNNVVRIVKVLGMVNSTPDFGNQPEVINGFSDFIVEIFGERGKHARAAVGMNALPRNMVCEIEMIVEVK